MYTIDRQADTPLYMQIRDDIIESIHKGELKDGDRLPPVAALAKEIGVTQATVRRALQDLVDQGHTECHVGRGTFVCNPPSPSGGQAAKMPADGMPESTWSRRSSSPPEPLQMATRRLRSGVKKALFDIMPLAHRPGLIQFTRGIPDDSLLPEDVLDTLSRQAFGAGAASCTEATDEYGMEELRREIARRHGGGIHHDQVLITNGSTQAISLIGLAGMEKRPGVICETPCFQGIPDAFAAMGHWVETVGRDSGGPIAAKLERHGENKPHVLYLCPYAHNPTGTSLSKNRYEDIGEWAGKTGSVIVADEIFKDLLFDQPQVPSLLERIGGDQAMVISSLSKSLMTGLRLGWVISSKENIRQLAQLKRLMDHCTPTPVQALALAALRSGIYDGHVDRMRTIYRQRMSAMLHALQGHMPQGVRWSTPAGGFSLMLELPSGYSSVALLLRAMDRGVSFLPGPLFDIDQRYVHALRLSTAWVDENQIREGVELLAGAIEELLSSPPEDWGLGGLGNFQ